MKPLISLRAWAENRRLELLVAATVFVSCAYFFQGGGWNQNAHYATTVSLVEQGTLYLDRYRQTTGDMSRAGEHVASAKPIGTALMGVPGYLVSGPLTLGIDNEGNRVIARAYLTTVLSVGVAMAGFALVVFLLLRRRLSERDAAVLALAMALATPLFPNSTMFNSPAYTALFGVGAYTLLEAPRFGGAPLTRRRLLVAGLLAGLPAVFEYLTAVIVVPLGLYALWQVRPRWNVVFYAAGVLIAAAIPMAHHTIVYGNPFHVGYASLVSPGFARDAAVGFMGIESFSLWRLYDLTLREHRGYFFLSPFLVAGVPGVVAMVRDRAHRPEGLVTAGVAWLIIGLVASLVYWHSGWSISSRYGLLFVAYSTVPVAVLYPRYRGWIGIGIAVGLFSMVLAAAVNAGPPPPGGRRAAHLSITGWLWHEFAAGEVATRHEPVLLELGVGNRDATWPPCFNLGTVVGLPAQVSIVPYLAYLALMARAIWRRAAPNDSSSRRCGDPRREGRTGRAGSW